MLDQIPNKIHLYIVDKCAQLRLPWTPVGNQCLCILFVINVYFVLSAWVYSVISQRFVIRRQSLDRHQHGSLRDKAPCLRAGSSSNLGTKLMMMALHDATWIMMLHSATRCYTTLLCATWCYMMLHDGTLLLDATWWYIMVSDTTWCYTTYVTPPES